MKLPCSILLIALLMAPAVAQKAPDADEAEVKAYRLDIDKLNKFAAATGAVMAYANQHKELQDAEEKDKDNKTISGMVRSLDKYPPVTAAIRSAGLTTREYAVMSMTLITTGMVVGMKKQGMLKEIPSSVSAANAAFVEQNYGKIEDMMKKMQSTNQ